MEVNRGDERKYETEKARERDETGPVLAAHDFNMAKERADPNGFLRTAQPQPVGVQLVETETGETVEKPARKETRDGQEKESKC
jgi:hypothetical protein